MILPKIKSMYFILTHKCNLKCKYCFVNQSQEVMSYETACKGIDFLVKDLPEGTKA
jgi:sulfatase maturation enzyme AslB (radical SAM superfamily)